MPAKLRIEAVYPENADTVYNAALSYNEMAEAMKSIAVYEGLPDGDLQEGQNFDVVVTFWGWMKNPPHSIYVETRNDSERYFQSREHGGWIKRWDHHLQILPDPKGCRWVDEIIIDGGWRTFFAAHFAKYVYSTRHKNRKALNMSCHIEKAA